MRVVEYKGKVVKTIFEDVTTDEEFEKCKKEYFTKPSYEEVKKEIKGIIRFGNEKKTLTNKYFLQEIHDKVVIKPCKWSLEDTFNCKSIFDIFYSRALSNEKCFPPENGTLANVLTAIRLGGKGIVRSATYFPINEVKFMLDKYCKKGGNYYDYSCGWGDRLLGALSRGVNYYGTDPNFELTAKLKDIDKCAREVALINSTTNIYTQGSEILIPELIDKIDLAFTSPPYFDLEDYKVGNQSFKEGTSYDSWLNNYMRPTMENIYQYVRDDGYFAINIKNSEEHNLMDDCVDLANKVGFKFLKFEELENITRVNGDGKVDNNELIAIFSKGAELPKEIKAVELW